MGTTTRLFLFHFVFCAVFVLPVKCVTSEKSVWRSSVETNVHPCNRPCHAYTPQMVCRYDFQVTMEHTKFKCKDCPTVSNSGEESENTTSVCIGNKCVVGDGHERPVYLVNNQFPGPDITVCEGDQIVVYVTNAILSGEVLTIHWHGIHQVGTPHMDGTPMVTQCPILQGSTFRYDFMANPPGTTFWHAHTGFLRAEGVVGPLIVRKRISLVPQGYADAFNADYEAKNAPKLSEPVTPKPKCNKRHVEDEKTGIKNYSPKKPSQMAQYYKDYSQNLPSQKSQEIATNRIKKQDKRLLSGNLIKEKKTNSTIVASPEIRIKPIEPLIAKDAYIKPCKKILKAFAQHTLDQDQSNVLMVQEWKHELSPIHYLHDNEDAPSLLVNGRQGTPLSPPAITVINRQNFIKYPPASDNDSSNASLNRYHERPWIRIVSNGFLFCPIQAQLEGHRFKLLATDGNLIESGPEFDILTIFGGERFDVELIETDESSESAQLVTYALRWIAHGDCIIDGVHANATSYVIYTQNNETVLEDSEYDWLRRNSDSFDWNAALSTLKVFNPVHMEDFNTNVRYVRLNELNSQHFSNNMSQNGPIDFLAKPDTQVDYKLYLFSDSFLIDEDIPMFNNISYRPPSAPLLSQYYQIPNDELCNLNTLPKCKVEFCSCTHIYDIPLGSVVELVLIDEGLNGEYDIHSVHLHGHHMVVLGQEKLAKKITTKSVKVGDRAGKLMRNFTHYAIKDSVAIPEGGYTIVRFKADNPGFWMLHCHLDFHFIKGMALIFKVGHVGDMPPLPKDFPKCGSWTPAETDHLFNPEFGKRSRYIPNHKLHEFRWATFRP